MKYFDLILVLLFSLIFISPNCFGQELESSSDESNQELYDFHISKHQRLKKTGFILLGSGVAASIAGALIASNSDGIFDDSDNLGTGAILFTAGALTTISSVPVFIVSGSNKRKAAALVQVGKHQIFDTMSISQFVSIGVKIEF